MLLEPTNYQTAYYVSDGLLAICCLTILFFVDVNVTKSTQNFLPALKRILNPATIVFLFVAFGNGIGHGIYITYVPVHMQEDLAAPSSMIGKTYVCVLDQ